MHIFAGTMYQKYITYERKNKWRSDIWNMEDGWELARWRVGRKKHRECIFSELQGLLKHKLIKIIEPE